MSRKIRKSLLFTLIGLVALFSACGSDKGSATKNEEASETALQDKGEDSGSAENAGADEGSMQQKGSPAPLPSDSTKEAAKEDAGSKNPWAKAYFDYLIDFERNSIDSYGGPEDRDYDYLYVNDDDIPELLLQGQDEATGNLILTYNDGAVDELQTSRLNFDYIERGNILNNSDGHMGYYHDLIYSIENGKWVEKATGEYYVDDNSVDWSDEDLIYEWNGETVSKEDYDKELDKIFDRTRAVPGVGTLSYDDMLETLLDDSEGIENSYLKDNNAIHKYEVIVKDVTWDEALKECKEKGGYLARINTDAEQYYLEDLLSKNGQEKLVLWIGGRLNPEDGHYHWFDGENYSRVSLDESNYYRFRWLNGEPSYTGKDADGNDAEENCMCMFRSQGFWQWNDTPADISAFYKGRVAYICEFE